jgi:OFA family oxalate/formate antiporter-like MFS transporter
MSGRTVAVIIAGFFTVFTAFAIRYSYGILLPEMLPSLAITKAQAGVIYAAYFIAYTIFSPLLGLMADKYNIRLILIVFPLLLCIGTLLMSFSSSLLNTSLFFALAGLGSAACWSPVVTLIPRWVSDKRRGFALAITDMGSTAGILAWSWAMPYIVEASSWMIGWTSLAIMAFIATILNAFLVKNYPDEKLEVQLPTSRSIEPKAIGKTYLTLLHDTKFWLIGLAYLFIGFSILIPFTFLPIHAMQTLDLSYQTAKWLIIIIAVTGIAGKLVLGNLSDTMGRIKIIMLCDMFIAAGGIGMAFSSSFATLSISSAILGIGYGALWPVYAAITGDYFPRAYSGTIIGLWTFYMGIGSIAAPPLAGWTIDSTGSFAWAFLLTAITAIISMLLLFPMIKVPSKSPDTI